VSTAITPERLVELRVEAQGQVGPFVDPVACNRATWAIKRRGEGWAAEVCGRQLDRRSVLRPDLPRLNTGEVELLVLADREEDRALFARIVS
jgi:hypothetical protein